jgi:hypothetical protein
MQNGISVIPKHALSIIKMSNLNAPSAAWDLAGSQPRFE